MSVWLRRQEIEVQREKVLAQGLSDIVGAVGGQSSVGDAFKKYTETIFPFSKQVQQDHDVRMKEVMEREVKKGPITFKPMAVDFLKGKTRTMQLPDEFSRKLRERAPKSSGTYGRKIKP